jgi:hypothetical protein
MQKLALIALVAAAGSANAAVVTQFNFNSNPSDANTATGITTPSTGAGSISTIGGVTNIFASGDASGGSTDPNVGDDSGFQTTSYPSASAGNETAGIQVFASTVGFTDISVSWDQRHSNTSSRFWAFFYTIDGSSWTRLSLSAANANPGATPSAGAPASTAGLFGGNGTFSAFDGSQTGAGDDWFNGRTVNLTGIAGVANNANFGFRVVSSFGSGSSYVASSGGNYAGTGTARFDMVTVSGIVPTPGAAALMGIGGLVAARRRRA